MLTNPMCYLVMKYIPDNVKNFAFKEMESLTAILMYDTPLHSMKQMLMAMFSLIIPGMCVCLGYCCAQWAINYFWRNNTLVH